MTTRITFTPAGFVETEALHAHLSSQESAPPAGPTTRVVDGALSITSGKGNVQQHGHARVQHGQDHFGTDGGSVMATRQRVNGHDTVELQPGVPGSRTHIAQAVREGLIRQTGNGIYEDQRATDGSQQVLQVEQPAPEGDPQGVFTDADEAAWSGALGNIPQGAADNAVAGIVAALAQGQDFSRAVLRLSQNTGMAHHEAAERIEAAVQVQEAVLTRAMAQAGLQGTELQAFFDATSRHPARFTDAMLHLVHARDPARFIAWGLEWSGNTARRASVGRDQRGEAQPPAFDAATLQAAGFETSTTKAGVLMVKPAGTSGRWVPADDLMKAPAPAAAPARPAPQRRAPTATERGLNEFHERLLRGSGFEVSTGTDGSVIARKGHGEWQRATDIIGRA